MGCGQSHIAVIYPRKGKGKNSGSGEAPYDVYIGKIKWKHAKGGSEDSEEECDGCQEGGTQSGHHHHHGHGQQAQQQAGGGQQGQGGGHGWQGDGKEHGSAASNPVAEESPPTSEADDAERLRLHISSSPLLAQAELSTSQSEFFKMLDEKINNGPDYDGSCEYEFAMDQAQLCRLLQEWQAAKLRSKCGLTGLGPGAGGPGQTPHGGHKLQRFHSLQSNGEPPSQQHHPTRKLHHQMSTTYAPPQYHYPPPVQYQYPYQCPPYPYQSGPPPPTPPTHFQVANSVVMYDKRGGYYTELA